MANIGPVRDMAEAGAKKLKDKVAQLLEIDKSLTIDKATKMAEDVLEKEQSEAQKFAAAKGTKEYLGETLPGAVGTDNRQVVLKSPIPQDKALVPVGNSQAEAPKFSSKYSKTGVKKDYLGTESAGAVGEPGTSYQTSAGKNLPVPLTRQAVTVGRPTVSESPSRVKELLALPPGRPQNQLQLAPAEVKELRALALYDTVALNKDPAYQSGAASLKADLLQKAKDGERAKKLLAGAGAAAVAGAGAYALTSKDAGAKSAPGQGEMSGGGEEQTAASSKKEVKKEVQSAAKAGRPLNPVENKLALNTYEIKTPEDVAVSMKHARTAVDEMEPSQAKKYEEKLSALEAEAKELKQLYKQGANVRMWAEVAEKFGHALAQIGAASYGLRTGVNMSGLKFDKTDWDKKNQLALDEYKSSFDELAGSRKETIAQGDKEESKRQNLLETLFKNRVASQREGAAQQTEQGKFEAEQKEKRSENEKNRKHQVKLKEMENEQEVNRKTEITNAKALEKTAEEETKIKAAKIQLESLVNGYNPKDKDAEATEREIAKLSAVVGVPAPNMKKLYSKNKPMGREPDRDAMLLAMGLDNPVIVIAPDGTKGQVLRSKLKQAEKLGLKREE